MKLVAAIATSIVEFGIPGIPEIATRSAPTALILEIQEITVSNKQRDPRKPKDKNLRKQTLSESKNPNRNTKRRNPNRIVLANLKLHTNSSQDQSRIIDIEMHI